MSKASKFKVGDNVRVTNTMHAAFDKVGVVHGHVGADKWLAMDQPQVLVRYPGAFSPLPTQERHLVLADSEPHAEPDPVNSPSHYTSHPSGVECIEITRHMGFNLGNAFKYIWRADLKGAAIQDLEKAIYYIKDEIAKREAAL